MAADPHTPVTGQTGSGNTVLIAGAAMQAAVREWQGAAVDATKGALDYEDFAPWACVVARELPETAAGCRRLYRRPESQRRGEDSVWPR